MKDKVIKMMKSMLLLILLGVVSGRRTQLLKGLPATASVEENAASGVSVYTFNVTVSPLSSEGVAIPPTIVNSNPLTDAFDIEPNGHLEYRVVTTGNPVLDYETMPKSFDLQIFVEDRAGRTDLNILTVQVTDENEHPVFRGNLAIQAVTIYILEGTPPECIYQVEAADPENAQLKYSLQPAPVPFLVLESGAIFSTKKFDYEKDPHRYFLNITVTDPGGLNSTKTVTVNIINIDDERPYFTTDWLDPRYYVSPDHEVPDETISDGCFPAIYAVERTVQHLDHVRRKQRIYRIPEEQSPGTLVANITAQDPDDEDSPSRLFYSIQSSNRYFSINPRTGALQVAGRIDRDARPLRLHPSVSLSVRVEDSAPSAHGSEIHITVIIDDVNDNAPRCNPSAFRREANENTTAGTVLLGLGNYCEDIDVDPANNRFNFTGLSGFGSNNFALESTFGRLVLNGSVDLENPANLRVEVYSLTVRVQDIAHPDYSNIIYIYIRIKPVNDFFPVFSTFSYEFNVPEITKVGSSIGSVNARDKDWPPSVITYSIVAGGGTRDYTNIFWINPNKGDVKILARLDYETTQKHILIVQASDQEKTATASVTVSVLEVNDEAPVCSPTFSALQVPASLAVGTNINGFRLECGDRDSDPRSLRYCISGGNVNNHFTFSPRAGSNSSRLILASRFDYKSGLDTTWVYRLHIHVTDDNLLSARDRATHLTTTGTVILTIRVIPDPTTAVTTTPAFTLVTERENLYSSSAWYVPFVVTLGSSLLLGLLGYLLLLLATRLGPCCPPAGKAHGVPRTNAPEKKKQKKDVVVTMTKLNTVFDGEATDPVSGRVYEFNWCSGARRWRQSQQPPELPSRLPPSARGTAEAPPREQPAEKRTELTAETRAAAKLPAEMPGQGGLGLPKHREESEDRGFSAPQGRH